MIVDNNIDEAAALAHVASSNDWIVTIKRGPLSALEHLDAVKPKVDVLVTDLMMDHFSGLELTKAIRDREEFDGTENPLPIFWFTGYEFNEQDEFDPIIRAKIKYSVKKIFRKPANPIELIAEIKKELGIDESA